jgi:hypothetical protein
LEILMTEEALDLIGDPAIIAKIVTLAQSQGLLTSKPMPTESISDAFDAPFGMDELKQVCEVITVVANTGTSAVAFLAAVKLLLSKSETRSGTEPMVAVRKTKGQRKIGTINESTNISDLKV